MSQADRPDADKSEFRTNISLINRVRDRTDVESWSQFYRFYQPLLTRYMRRLGLQEHAANDVIQDVFRSTVAVTSDFRARPQTRPVPQLPLEAHLYAHWSTTHAG